MKSGFYYTNPKRTKSIKPLNLLLKSYYGICLPKIAIIIMIFFLWFSYDFPVNFLWFSYDLAVAQNHGQKALKRTKWPGPGPGIEASCHFIRSSATWRWSGAAAIGKPWETIVTNIIIIMAFFHFIVKLYFSNWFNGLIWFFRFGLV